KPDGPDWQQTVRDRWTHYLLGKCHQVMTGVCLRSPNGQLEEFLTVTEVCFLPASRELVDWYIRTEEPLGKAGGYGLQGAASLFVKSIHGSPTNVIGLPLMETWHALQRAASTVPALPTK